MILAILFGVLFVQGLIGVAIYWFCKVKPDEELEMTPTSVVPQSLKGSWPYDLFSCCDDLGTCFWGCCCSACMMCENMYRWGHANAWLGCTGFKGGIACSMIINLIVLATAIPF